MLQLLIDEGDASIDIIKVHLDDFKFVAWTPLNSYSWIGIHPYLGDGHGALVTVLFEIPHIGELKAVAAQLLKLPDIGRG